MWKGVAKPSITILAKSLKELEKITEEPKTRNLAQRIIKLLRCYSDFKEYHVVLIDLVEENETSLGSKMCSLSLTMKFPSLLLECSNLLPPILVPNQNAYNIVSPRLPHL